MADAGGIARSREDYCELGLWDGWILPRSLAQRIELQNVVLAGFRIIGRARFGIILFKVGYQHRLRMAGVLFGKADHLLAKGGVCNLQIGQHQAQAFLIRCASGSPQALSS